MKLVDTINNEKSVVELYLSDDGSQVIERKCLTENRCKEYSYSLDQYFSNPGVTRTTKNKIAIAMAN
ncbi:MAG TPA: hypothetical protein VJ949_06380 [Cryomorphaceae bacterium]|nr:hypothetical protein [Cryomorphaceae bacterium]